MPFDLSSDEKIVMWRGQADGFRELARTATSNDQRAAYIMIAESYDSLILSEEELIRQRRRGIIHNHQG